MIIRSDLNEYYVRSYFMHVDGPGALQGARKSTGAGLCPGIPITRITRKIRAVLHW